MSRPSWPELQGTSVELNINGKAVTIDADPNMPLLWVLRDTLNMTGTKFGCGVAACGACTVHIDGEARAHRCPRSVTSTIWPGWSGDCAPPSGRASTR